jgi:predicted nucleotidyltransferase
MALKSVMLLWRRHCRSNPPRRDPDERALQDIVALPNSGMIVPGMGTTKRGVNLAGALFTPVQARVLGLLFAQPDRTFQSAEIIRLARSGTGAVHRQLARLEAAGLVTVERSGNQKFYRAKHDSPVFGELSGLIVKTVGVTDPIRLALGTLQRKIRAAFVYGSIAKRTDRASSDIDLLVVSDSVTYADVFDALQKTESALGRGINPTVLSISDWQTKWARKDSFVARIAGQEKLFVIGSESELA